MKINDINGWVFDLSQAESFKGSASFVGFGLEAGRNIKRRSLRTSAVKITCLILLVWLGSATAGSVYDELKEKAENDRLVEEYMEQINSQEEMAVTYPEGKELEKIGRKLAQWKKDWEKILRKTQDEIPFFKSPSLKEKRLQARSKEISDVLKKKVDLETLIAATLERNPAISEAKKRWQGVLEKFSQADRLEHLMLQYESFVMDLGISAKVSKGAREEFPYPGLTSLKGDIALKEAEIAREKYLLKVRDVLTQTETAYYQRVFLVHAIEIIEEDIKALERPGKLGPGPIQYGKNRLFQRDQDQHHAGEIRDRSEQ